MSEQQHAPDGDRVTAVANRLRLLQMDFADQSEADRRGYLAEELGRTLASLPPSERKAFLEQLGARFPTWDENVRIESRPATAARPAFDEKELNDASFLVTRLIAVAQGLPPEQRAAVTARLREARLAPAGAGPSWPEAQANDLRAKLKASPADPIDPTRVLELLAQLAEVICSLDQVVWNTWRVISPQGNVKRPAVLQNTLARFISGDQDVPRGQVAHDVGKLRQLIAALIGAVSQTGRFAIQHFKGLAPDEIKVLVGTSGFGLEGRYWRKYVELAGQMDQGAVQDAIRQAIAEYAEALIRGTR
ncbi:MAG TPA: hypothetical protein VGI81_12745 [Tepidisphaeraceae bacterium]|jgi:hypothetical protein